MSNQDKETKTIYTPTYIHILHNTRIKYVITIASGFPSSLREWRVWCDEDFPAGGGGELEGCRTCSVTLPSSLKACDRVITVVAVRRIERTCDQNRGGSGRNSSAHWDIKTGPHRLLSPPSTSPAPSDNMDCGIFTSKTVLLFLSLIFWVSRAVLSLHLQRFEFTLNWLSRMEKGETKRVRWLFSTPFSVNHRCLLLLFQPVSPVCFNV